MPRLAKPVATKPTLADTLAAWERALRVEGRSPRTIKQYAYATQKMAERWGGDCPVAEISREDIEALILDLRDAGMTPAGLSGVFRPVRTYFNWLVARGFLPVSPLKGMKGPQVRVQPVRFPTDDEWSLVLRTTVTRAAHAFRARRDRAILLVMSTTGARLAEVAGMTLDDVDLATGTILLHGKGGKDRYVAVDGDAKDALTAYLKYERPRSDHAALPAVWLAPKGAMTPSGVYQMVADRAKSVGVELHPHALRHRFVSKALEAGTPAPILMTMTGHSTASMLNRYGAWNRQQTALAAMHKMSASGAL